MPVTAKLNYLRMAPRKVRLVTNLIRGLNVIEAQTQLKFLSKRAAGPILKLLKSAIANAKHNFDLAEENLYIAKISVDQGPSLKRWLPRAMGRATPIIKRTSHITIVLEAKTNLVKSKKKKVEPAKKAFEVAKKIKPVVKKPKKVLPRPKPKLKPKRPEKVITKKKGVEEVVRRIFRRKSL